MGYVVSKKQTNRHKTNMPHTPLKDKKRLQDEKNNETKPPPRAKMG